MSLDKAIEHRKEKRKPYRGSKAICKTCRNHGGCDWCKENRLHKFKKTTIVIDEFIQFDETDTTNVERNENV